MFKNSFIVILICLLFCLSTRLCGQFLLVIPFKKNIDSLYYSSKTTWIAPAPIMFTKQTFSADSGKTYVRAGLLGQKLNLALGNNPDAKRNLNTFRILRIAGLAQMVVLAPIFLAKEISWTNEFNRKYSPPYPDKKSPGYIWYSFGFLYTGAITYHVISKPFFRKALRKHYYR